MADQTRTPPKRDSMSVRNIKTNTDVFQFRHVEVDQHHVDALARVLGNGNPFDRLTIWQEPETGAFIVVDGHHRLAAYKQSGWHKKVPVVIHVCDLKAARLLALAENVKTRLSLTNGERMDAAWRLVSLAEYSKRDEARASGVSDGTVANMRRTRLALLKKDPEDDLPTSWWQALEALREGEGREYSEAERDAIIKAKTAQLDEQIGRPLGFMAANQIEAACAVVAKRLGRKGIERLLEDYGYLVEDFGLEDEEDEDGEE